MTRREIIEAAKQLILLHGPATFFEFGDELVSNAHGDSSYEEREAIWTEAKRQANRVYDFLGYESPWKD